MTTEYSNIYSQGSSMFVDKTLQTNVGHAETQVGIPTNIQNVFYGIVVDIIKTSKVSEKIINEDSIPNGYKDETNKFLYNIGRCQVRLMNDIDIDKSDLVYAFPLETDIKNYPLINEPVIIYKFINNICYYQPIKIKNWTNHNLDFSLEDNYGVRRRKTYNKQDINLNTSAPYGKNNPEGPEIENSEKFTISNVGQAGKYFNFNKLIRPLFHYEGDTIIESRFGSSIRFGSYVDNKTLDEGVKDTGDLCIDYSKGMGNPMILIRNRQRQLTKQESEQWEHPIIEDINRDGSCIWITSGKTIPPFTIRTIKKFLPQEESKEFIVPEFSDFPSQTKSNNPLNGNQIIFNSDRLVFQSKINETFFFSRKRFSITTDDKFSVDAKNRIALTTYQDFTVNSPKIYLGDWTCDGESEPAILGTSLILWLQDLCKMIARHTHNDPRITTSTPVNAGEFLTHGSQATKLKSNRVFLVGPQGYKEVRSEGIKSQKDGEPQKLPEIQQLPI